MPQSHESFAAIGDKLANLPSKAATRLLATINWIDTIDDVIDTLGVPAVKAKVRELYTKYIVPVDIPYLPDFAEAWLDQMAMGLLDEAIERAHARIHKD